MTAPHHVYYVRSNDEPVQTIHDVIQGQHLDEVWSRIVGLNGVEWHGANCIQVELYHLREGTPLLTNSLGMALSEKMGIALRFSIDSTRQSVAYQVFKDGKLVTEWAGNIASFPICADAESPTQDPEKPEKDLVTQAVEAFQHDFFENTGLYICSLINSCATNPKSCDIAIEGVEIFVRGRFLYPVPGMGRWPEMFRFHDRAALEGYDTKGQDQLALLAIDQKLVERLWRRTPAKQVYQFLRMIEPLKITVLGPMSHVFPEVLESIEKHPPEAPLSSAEHPNINILEVIAMSTACVYMVGDGQKYFDECFFPLISLADGAISREAILDRAEDIVENDILSAMTEVLPYSVPEGELLESFGDEEISPLAPWAVKDGSYEGSLFLVQAERIGQLIENFDIDVLKNKVQDFRDIWFEATQNQGTSKDDWMSKRHDSDKREISRFEDTFVELQHLVGLAKINGLSLALLFYC